MSRAVARVAALVAIAAPATSAFADGGPPPGADPPTETSTSASTSTSTDAEPDPNEPPDQALAATLGAAAGGRVTPGGLRVGGRYLYRLSTNDWFEGHVAVTFGRGDARCFRDRDDDFLCDHGTAEGFAAEVGGGIRRRFLANGRYQPFVRAALGARVSRFGADDVQGFVIPLTAAGGVRVAVGEDIAISAEGALELGVGFFGHGLGTEPQLGLAIAAMVEFAL
jgi:hypothetical protein